MPTLFLVWAMSWMKSWLFGSDLSRWATAPHVARNPRECHGLGRGTPEGMGANGRISIHDIFHALDVVLHVLGRVFTLLLPEIAIL